MTLEFFKNCCQKNRCQWNSSRIFRLINKARNYIFASILWSWNCHLLYGCPLLPPERIRILQELLPEKQLTVKFFKNSSPNKQGKELHSCVNLMILKLLNGDEPSIPYVLVASLWHYIQNRQMLSKNAISLIKSYKSCPLVTLKMTIFLDFQYHARQG